MRIGNYTTRGNIFLAPMAGVTDLPFRIICNQYGSALTYTEMVNAKAICYEDPNTYKMIQTADEEGEVAVQIFGSDPHFMGEAAKILSDLGRFCMIDINMGCPVPKVVKNGEGSALMKDTILASKIIESVKKKSNIPVTVKFRKGWDDNNINAVSFAEMAEKSGADTITVHGRTRAQYYSGKADWEIIKQVKNAVNVPVIANGDIFTIRDAIEVMEITKADGIMIGRGAQGNPFIFNEFNDFEMGKQFRCSIQEKIDTMIHHYELSVQFKGEAKSVCEMRKHIGWYLKGLPGSAKIRDEINRSTSKEEVLSMARNYLQTLLGLEQK